MRLGQKLFEGGDQYAEAFNFGPNTSSAIKVCEIAKKITEIWGKGTIEVSTSDGLHEATLLQLDIEKAKQILGIIPVYNLDEALKVTVYWYMQYYLSHTDMQEYSFNQIDKFISSARAQNIGWSYNG